MDGDWIAFQREMINAPHLVLYNIVSGHEMLITDTLYTGASDPAIHGDWVVYSNPFDGQIRAYKLSTQEILELSSPSIYFHINPDIYQQIVVWQQVDFQDYSVDIVGYDLSNNTPFTISAQIGNEGNPKVYEDIVVWDWNGDIYSYNLATSQYMTLTNDPFPQMTPDIYENLIVWRDGRHNRWDIYGIDLQTNEVFSVTQGINPVPDTYSPDIWGNIVAWHGPGNQGAAAAIKMTEFSFLPLLNNP
jgi:beta propeller repeat protein